ncbi:MAG TPA: histidine--tRNA ligase [Candidatus Pacebacteria bacterium]|nr:MAG: Histidine-tRNA ligase [Microgenomates group bacterium GW2011_GWB1_45_17]KKU24161.1 MAG: Histidine-tRNA ligase [Microgenomates group bacterium GW2011_GWC1_46_15]KKU24876.1 MAG: Histidine-tRNA ligase [Microgenomates group bacterium GW2011_GWA1_46_15]HAV14749.1 histidine--tRNA ligase [Candidatus Paceibacterota bacterium]HCR11455.1 histidine--tRNA ligase [Candidatus Paceibacterota bacterium]
MATQTQPQTLKGFRDFLPEEKRIRNFVMGKITEVFELYGFEPLETPTLEYASLLLGKYGDEADKLVYTFTDNGNRRVGLRYDQTVPTARVLAQYRDQLPQYFRRYQMQNVFRADKPQKGRYREFTQCDIDIFGSTSPLADAEIIACTYAAFVNVGFSKIVLRINDRKVLFDALQPFATEQVSTLSMIQSIDKLDKLPQEEIVKELCDKGLRAEVSQQVLDVVQAAQPTKNLQQIMDITNNLGVPKEAMQFSPFLARGLDYYTGMIFEVILPDFPMGSFGGGGRYDNLIAQLGSVQVPAVGIAFGFDRMVEAVKTLGIGQQKCNQLTVLVTVFDVSLQAESAKVAATLRAKNISTELYPSADDKLAKQFKYAAKRKFTRVIVIGPDEVVRGVVQVKTMETGNQQTLPLDDVVAQLKTM